MSVKEKVYWELTIEINPLVSEVVCDIVQSEFDCEGIVTSEETFKNLERIKKADDRIKAYIVADNIDEEKIKKFFKEKRKYFTDNKIFNFDIGTWEVSIKKQEIVDWSKKWKEHWKPSKVSGRIVICPSWEKYEARNKEIIVLLDPGNAFGTGTHSTTQLCIQACEKYMKKGDIVADIGTGSGILSICAMKLGANNVDAVDNDETVIETAINNAKMNNEDKIDFKTGISEFLESEKYDFVFANILHNVLAEIMPDLKRIMKPKGKIVLSGILDGKENIVVNALKENKMQIIEEMKQKEWFAYVAEKGEMDV